MAKYKESMLTEELAELIPPPGCFTVFHSKPDRVRSSQKPNMLNIFKKLAEAEKVYKAYAQCQNNAASLLAEAKLLFRNKSFARAVALGITAWEELGKSQIAADYYSGVLSDVVYKEAFRNHKLKTSYLVRTGTIGNGQGVAFNPIIGEKLEKLRQSALYVSESNNPTEQVSEDDAVFVLRRVSEHLEYIRFAEALNCRIGSKALFK